MTLINYSHRYILDTSYKVGKYDELILLVIYSVINL